jgi:hypothetical protein
VALRRADPLAAEVDGVTGEVDRLRAPSDPVAGLEHDHALAGVAQAPRRGQSGQSGSDDDRVEDLVAHAARR